MAEEIIVDIKINAESGGKSLSGLRKEFKELQKELNDTDVSSKQYIETLKKLGAVKDEIGDLNTTIKALNPEGKVQALGTAIGGVASGFQAATAATALFGNENEQLNKQLLKVQAAMAFTDGIKGLVGLGDAFTVLKTVILSNPLFILATVVTGVGVAMYALKDSIKPIGEAFKTVGDYVDAGIQKLKEFTDYLGLTNFKEEENKKRSAEYVKQKEESEKRLAKIREDAQDKIEKQDKANHDAYLKRQKEKEEKRKEAEAKRIEDAKNAAAGLDEFEKLSQEIDAIRDKAKEQKEKDYWDALQLKIKNENEALQANNKILEDIEKQKVQFQKDSITSIQSLSDTVFSTRLANAKKGSKEEERLMKQQFDINKAVSLSVASINAYQSIGAFLKTNPLTVAGIPNPGAIAGLAALVTTNTANIAKIAATKFNSGGGSGSTGGGGQTATRVSATNAPTVNAPATQTTQLNEDGSVRNAPQQVQPIVKAVVVETDITKTQKNVSGIQERAKY